MRCGKTHRVLVHTCVVTGLTIRIVVHNVELYNLVAECVCWSIVGDARTNLALRKAESDEARYLAARSRWVCSPADPVCPWCRWQLRSWVLAAQMMGKNLLARACMVPDVQWCRSQCAICVEEAEELRNRRC